MRYLISHPEALAELGDFDVALYDGKGPLPDDLDDVEFYADHPLWSAPNVLISPHVGGLTAALGPRARRLLVEQVRRHAAGEPLANVVISA